MNAPLCARAYFILLDRGVFFELIAAFSAAVDFLFTVVSIVNYKFNHWLSAANIQQFSIMSKSFAVLFAGLFKKHYLRSDNNIVELHSNIVQL